MNLAVQPPILPMLAKRVDEVPAGGDWIFEPKWDGFRALIFNDGDEILIQSRDEKPLNRYFPELIDPLRSAASRRDACSTAKLSSRATAHSISTRCNCASIRRPRGSSSWPSRMPASVVFFDLLCEGDRDLAR